MTGTTFLIAQAVAIPAAVSALAILWAYLYLGNGAWGLALKGTCLILLASLLIEAAAIVQLRIVSPDVSLKWYFIPVILGEGLIVGLTGFVGFDSLLRYLALATSALAPLMLMCVRHVER